MVVLKRSLLCLALALTLVPLVPLGQAAMPATSSVTILAPAAGSTVSGPTAISGSSVRGMDMNGDGFVVIAVLDTGINPYNSDFAATPAQPTAGSGTAYPSRYIPGYPSGVPAIARTCTATTSIPALCASDFSAVTTNRLYWFNNTKVIGAISFDYGRALGPSLILDDHDASAGHGTKSASVAVGDISGTCPECLLVVVEGLGGEALTWASSQSWIDITSNSYGIDMRGALGGDPTAPALVVACAALCATDPADQAFIEAGGTAVFAAGNGNFNMFESPQSTHISPLAGPDWHIVAGAIDKADNSSIMGSGKPVTISSYGLGAITSACYNTRDQSCTHSGTSAATPQSAGVIGRVLLEARFLMGDGRTGPRGASGGSGIAANGTAIPGNQYLSDGKLSRAELWSLALKTARPIGSSPSPSGVYLPGVATPVDYGYVGYGIMDRYSRDDAVLRLDCGADLPDRSDVDDFMATDSDVRQSWWGTWSESKFGATPIGAAGVPLCPAAVPLVALTVNGSPAGTATPDAAGAWTGTIDFGAYTPVAGAYTVVAKYGPASDSRTFMAPVAGGGGPGAPTERPRPPGAPADARTEPDRDGDGVPDSGDDCVSTPNPGQEDADHDTLGDACDDDDDADGAPDSTDNCVGLTNAGQADRDADGRGDACDDDLDGDTVRNADDNCVGTRNLAQDDLDRDGVGDACDTDRDGDGIPDLSDAYPDDAARWLDVPAMARSNPARPNGAAIAPAAAQGPGAWAWILLACGLALIAFVAVAVARRRE